MEFDIVNSTYGLETTMNRALVLSNGDAAMKLIRELWSKVHLILAL
jgi:hypothetical protein